MRAKRAFLVRTAVAVLLTCASVVSPGVFGTLGVGAGFAIAAKLARPEADVWIVFGDGSCGYSLAEYDTMARHNLGAVAVVGNDACWTQIVRASPRCRLCLGSG